MNKHETIADIIAEMRDLAEHRDWNNHTRQSNRERVSDIADRLEAAHRRELSKICPKTGGDFGQLGDCAKLREACANIAEYARSAQCHTEDAHVLGYLNQIERWAKAALAAPPRNCDVGTVTDQRKRYAKMCKYNCDRCALQDDRSLKGGCEFSWAQMPYEKGGAE